MSKIGRRTLIFIIVLIGSFLILFSYFFSGSRADRITSDKEYIEALEEASRGKQLAGQQPIPTLSQESNEIIQPKPTNLLEELIFQIKALFKAR